MLTLYEGLVDDDERDAVKQLIRGKTRYDGLPTPRPTSVELFVCSENTGASRIHARNRSQ